MKFPMCIVTNKRTIRVLGYIDTESVPKDQYEDGKGYIDENGIVRVYSDHEPPMSELNTMPYIWKDPDSDNYKMSNPEPIIINMFKEDRLVDDSVDNITKSTSENDVFYDEKELSELQSKSDLFIPIIRGDDDFLKKIIKMAIIKKGINVKRLMTAVPKPYQLANMKIALQNTTAMSTKYFVQWAEMLGLDFEIAVTDNGEDLKDPLKEKITYVSYKDDVLDEEEYKEFLETIEKNSKN